MDLGFGYDPTIILAGGVPDLSQMDDSIESLVLITLQQSKPRPFQLGELSEGGNQIFGPKVLA